MSQYIRNMKDGQIAPACKCKGCGSERIKHTGRRYGWRTSHPSDQVRCSECGKTDLIMPNLQIFPPNSGIKQ